mgnify:CR=1 FL=1
MENKVTADYVDEEGCLHCGICGKRKQMKVSLMGFEHVVSCLCECEVKARQEPVSYTHLTLPTKA